MLYRSYELKIESIKEYDAVVSFTLGKHSAKTSIPIQCPNESLGGKKHEIAMNGHDTSVKGHPQQFTCKSCGKNFYAHTSKFFEDLKPEIRSLVESIVENGKLNVSKLKEGLDMDKSAASRLLRKIIRKILQTINTHQSFFKMKRKSTILFIDETFLTINHKTWYLIVITNGDNEIMAIKLVKRREKSIILDMVNECATRMPNGLEMLITDGFTTYKGVARGLNRAIIHVRHIHKPPYGRIEIDTYTYTKHDVIITTAKTTNEILAVNGYFLAQVKEEKRSLGKRKRGRKPGAPNRSKEVIKAEKKAKEKNKKSRGRPKGSKNKQEWITHVFNHRKKVGVILAVGDSSKVVETAMNNLLRHFGNKYITTNLVEKEFSVLKKLIDFRGKRNEKLWAEILNAYFTIRDNPSILEKALESLKISSQMVQKMLPLLTHCEVIA